MACPQEALNSWSVSCASIEKTCASATIEDDQQRSALKLQLKDGPNAVHAKPRRYPPEKRSFLGKHVAQLQKLGLVKLATQTD